MYNNCNISLSAVFALPYLRLTLHLYYLYLCDLLNHLKLKRSMHNVVIPEVVNVCLVLPSIGTTIEMVTSGNSGESEESLASGLSTEPITDTTTGQISVAPSHFPCSLFPLFPGVLCHTWLIYRFLTWLHTLTVASSMICTTAVLHIYLLSSDVSYLYISE